MNYKKLLKNILLSVGTIVTASNTVFGISLEEFWNALEWQDAKKIVKNAIINGQINVGLNQLIQAGVDNPYGVINVLSVRFNRQIREANRIQPMEEETENQQSFVISGSEDGDDSVNRQQLNIYSVLNTPLENINYFPNYKTYIHYFCTLPTLRKEATFQSINVTNFYGINLKYFEPSASSDLNNDVFCDTCDEIFHKSCTIHNFYLPFFQYDLDAIFSFFTNLHLINFQTYGQAIWLPPYENIDRNHLKALLENYMRELSEEEDCEFIRFDVNPIIAKVNFYTQDQITAIENQHIEFYDFVRYHSLEKYIQYINHNEKPNWLTPYEWNNFVLPMKVEAQKLMALMRGMKLNR